MAKPEITTTYDTKFFDEVVKQTGTQAALIAGFTFTILKDIPFNGVIAYKRCVALLISACITIGLELLAAIITAHLAFIVKADDSIDIDSIYEKELGVAYFSYVTGIITFIICVLLLAAIKYETVFYFALIPLIIIILVGAGTLISIVTKNNQHVKTTQDPELKIINQTSPTSEK